MCRNQIIEKEESSEELLDKTLDKTSIKIINLGVTHLHQYHTKYTCNLKHMVLARHGRLLKY
jgi:hypothetical protein